MVMAKLGTSVSGAHQAFNAVTVNGLGTVTKIDAGDDFRHGIAFNR